MGGSGRRRWRWQWRWRWQCSGSSSGSSSGSGSDGGSSGGGSRGGGSGVCWLQMAAGVAPVRLGPGGAHNYVERTRRVDDLISQELTALPDPPAPPLVVEHRTLACLPFPHRIPSIVPPRHLERVGGVNRHSTRWSLVTRWQLVITEWPYSGCIWRGGLGGRHIGQLTRYREPKFLLAGGLTRRPAWCGFHDDKRPRCHTVQRRRSADLINASLEEQPSRNCGNGG